MKAERSVFLIPYDSDNRVLCPFNSKHGLYHLFGGKTDEGESDIEALARELHEECSITLRNPRYMGEVSYVHKCEDGDIKATQVFYCEHYAAPVPPELREPKLTAVGHLSATSGEGCSAAAIHGLALFQSFWKGYL